MNIKPGIGFDQIKFGITELELISIIGKPDKVDECEYVKGNREWHRVLWYFAQNIHFTFDKDDNYRLGTITIMGSGYSLFDKELFSLPLETVKRFLVMQTSEIPKVEDWTFDNEVSHICLDHDGLGIIFWFDDGNLSEMQCSYLFQSDNETVIWP